MKNLMKKVKELILVIAGLVLIVPACTNLDEELYSDLDAASFFKSEDEYISALGAAYANFTAMGSHSNVWSTNELSSDELVVPTRGGDWYDGGVLLQVHQHTYTPDNGFVTNAWNTLYAGVNTCNRLIYQFKDVAGSEAYIAELRAIRAYWYYQLLDMFGNVPLSIDFEVTEALANSTRQQVYSFVESELNAVIPVLPTVRDASTYGRMTKWAALAIRHKLYLNAGVYTGTAQWAAAKADAEAIGAAGYTLEAKYQDNFAIDNSGSNENIFVVPYDKVFAGGFNWVQMTLHYASQNTYKLQAQPWNGYATVEEFYNSYIDPVNNPGTQGTVFKGKGTDTGTQDGRLTNFVVGPQGTEDPAGGETGDDDGLGLNFTPYINSIWPDACRQCGARIGKYAYENGGTPNMSNDWVVFRYGDILLGLAEAEMQLGDNAAALALVNQIRARAGNLTPFAGPLTADQLLAERGREMYVENVRRQDLIRFGKYNDAWWEKEASAATVNIFPIPKSQMDANTKLTQNPGYN
jgi:hypothetical protein